MDDELKLAAAPIYRKRYGLPSDAEVIDTVGFEHWFSWFFEEEELEPFDWASLEDEEMPH